MSHNIGVLAVIAVVVFVSTSAASGVTTSRKVLRIDAQARGINHCAGKFVLSLGVDLDGGKTECDRKFGSSGKTREGLPFEAVRQTTTFIGKAGTIAIVSTGYNYSIGFGDRDVWEGTWTIVKGTDRNAGIRGGGIWKGVDNPSQLTLSARYAGLVSGA